MRIAGGIRCRMNVAEVIKLTLNHGVCVTREAKDVSEATLREAAEAISADYPDLEVYAIVGDFTFGFDDA